MIKAESDLIERRSTWWRKYEKGDEHGILDLFRIGGIARTIEEWFWEYRDNPYGNFIWVGEHGGQIIGHLASLPAQMRIGDRKATGIQTVDVIVHPKFRHQGMLVEMGKASAEEARKRGIGLTYGFPNRPTGHQKYGGFVICKIPSLVRFVNIGKTVDFLQRRYRIPRVVAPTLLRVFLLIIGMFTYLHSRIADIAKYDVNLANVKIRAVTSFDDRIDDFWKRASKFYDITVIRNRKYLNWRYVRKPNVKYAILLAEKKEKNLGYIVLRCRNEKNLKLGYIVDVLASSADVAQLLFSKAIEHFKKENVDAMICFMLKNNVYYKILRFNNFVPIESTWFVAMVDSSWLSEKFVRDYTSWYVTMGDTDYI